MKKKNIPHIDLKSIKSPDFLKELDYQELNVLSSDIAKYLVDITSKNGGHLSSNLGVVDATIALCRAFDFNKDKIIFDVGHQSYTYKLLTGRDLSLLRKKDGVSGFQKLDESSFDHYEAGHSSTSISAALGMAMARDYKKEKYEVISFIGDSSFTNGLALEAINNARVTNNKVIIVLNDNDMSISKSVGGISHVLRNISISSFYRKSRNAFKKMMSLTALGRALYHGAQRAKNWVKRVLIRTSFLDGMGIAIVGPVDGHDIKSMERCFKKAKKNDKSTLIIIKTVKGKGYKYAEEDKTGKWHGVPSFNIETGEFYDDSNVTWSKYFSHLVGIQMEKDPLTVTIAPGTAYGSGLSRLFELYPNRIIDVGIAEEHAFTLASGLSVSGMHPNIVVYSTFLQRAYDELSHDLARMNLDVTVLVDRAGLVGSDGETHQGLYDEAFLNSIPNVTIAMASNTLEAKALYLESYTHHGVFVIRFPKENVVKTSLSYSSEYGKMVKVLDGNKKCIISIGPIINELKSLITSNQIDAALYNALYIKPLDVETLKEIANKFNKIIVYDPYSTLKGLPEIVASKLMELGYKGELILRAISDTFVKQASIKQQRELYHLSPEEIVKL